MSGNASGNYYTTTEAMMKAFDTLPKAVRIALANSLENWVPQPLCTRVKELRKRKLWPSDIDKTMLVQLERWNATERDEHWYRMERMAEHGTDYNARIRRDAVTRKAAKKNIVIDTSKLTLY